MKRSAAVLAVVAMLCGGVAPASGVSTAQAQAGTADSAPAQASAAPAAVPQGSEMLVATRGINLPVYAVWRDDAVATLVLYSGGDGGYGHIGADGWPTSKNFLIRSARLFAAQPFNVVLVGLAPDLGELDGSARIGEQHNADNQAIFRAIKNKSPAPIWLVGTSKGTISAAAAAIHDDGGYVAGVVLTSSLTAYSVTGAVPTQALDRIKVPVLVMHHERDACRTCRPYEAKDIVGKLVNSPVKKWMPVSGGGDPSGDPCGPLHYHGYIGMEPQVVGLIADWIRHPVN